MKRARQTKKGIPVHLGPMVDHFESYISRLSPHFHKGLFTRVERTNYSKTLYFF
jgi:hypothetical protein